MTVTVKRKGEDCEIKCPHCDLKTKRPYPLPFNEKLQMFEFECYGCGKRYSLRRNDGKVN